MSVYFKKEQFASLVRGKRGRKGLREASDDIGCVSASTISRIENSNLPDIDTLLALCDWLEVSPSELFGNTEEEKEKDTAEAIAFLLRADSNLNPDAVNVLVVLIRAAYQEFCCKSSIGFEKGDRNDKL